jgi:hypothetical protein
MLKNPAEYERDIYSAKFTAISHQVSPNSLVYVSAGICQRALVDESGMIRTQTGHTIDKKMVTVAWDALYDTTS